MVVVVAVAGHKGVGVDVLVMACRMWQQGLPWLLHQQQRQRVLHQRQRVLHQQQRQLVLHPVLELVAAVVITNVRCTHSQVFRHY